jgi:phage shock protein C
MYCTRCGTQLNDTARFCSDCGCATANNAHANQQAWQTQSRLTRPREDRKVAGVCAGFARYLNVDVTLVRLFTLILALCSGGIGFVGYLLAWIVMPNDPWPVSTQQQTAGSRA